MIQRIGQLLLALDRLMLWDNPKEIEHSTQSKIRTDANGGAVLNMNNPQVCKAMIARMKELAAKIN
ncbi:hypothetical protein EDWATA_01704 [Edwardsiella tarda ATCC 23685]|uniref:Uncharacterized protein n=1 Tax=Edwardsiella tarda ATCC 23685 TaxID=500638 RepID=D4F4N1_EDWTA|nr:hypothetical protein EDWATA_01704 [Edwardsiella tarda ATCC 23685]GAC63277.1 hypothetical protein ET1_04_00240 [Edwardsiella tarda ATCC 15947 = NBRC 105688]STD46490.1 Uncharacterised protein [Edwardsiella tarda]